MASFGRIATLAIGVAVSVPAHARSCPEPPPGASTLTMTKPRSPLWVLLNQPSGHEPVIGVEALHTILEQELELRTDLAIARVDEHLTTPCAGELACWAERIPSSTATRHLLLVNSIPAGDSDILFSMWIDLEMARDIAAHATPEARAARAAAAVMARTARRAVRSVEDARAAFRALLDVDLRTLLMREGHWRSSGWLRIDLPESGFLISIDDTPIGTTETNQALVCEVKAGLRRVRVDHPRYATRQEDLTVRPNTATFFVPLPTISGSERARAAAFWAGVAMVAAGTGATALAIAKDLGDEMQAFCGGPPGTCPAGGGFRAIGPVLVAPLGYSLSATGAIWALAPAGAADDELSFWLWIAGGIVVGAASYGISAALNPG